MVKSLTVIFFAALMVSCDHKQSLQEFYVEKHEDSNYKAVDLPASLLVSEEADLEPFQRETLETIKKVNILAFPLKEGNEEQLQKERADLAEILADEKYNLLFKFGSNEQRAEFYYIGEEESVDELVVVGYNEGQGFGVARLLGKNMNPDDIMQLMKSFNGNDINPEGFKQVQNLFISQDQKPEREILKQEQDSL